MRITSVMAGGAALLVGLAGIRLQISQWSTPTQPLSDVSPYQGRVVKQPEDLSGIWEAPDDEGGAVGLQLTLQTTVSADEVSLKGVPQAWYQLFVGVYQRRGLARVFGDTNYFGDTPRGGMLRVEGDRLLLHVPEVGVDLDLQRTAGDAWVGRLHRQGFDRQVLLRRPSMAANEPAHWFLGTWINRGRPPVFPECLHVGLTAGGGVVAWVDALQVLGRVRYGPGVTRQTVALEGYGVDVQVRPQGEDQLIVTSEGPNSRESVIQHGKARSKAALAGVEPFESDWHRVEGASCIADLPVAARE